MTDRKRKTSRSLDNRNVGCWWRHRVTGGTSSVWDSFNQSGFEGVDINGKEWKKLEVIANFEAWDTEESLKDREVTSYLSTSLLLHRRVGLEKESDGRYPGGRRQDTC